MSDPISLKNKDPTVRRTFLIAGLSGKLQVPLLQPRSMSKEVADRVQGGSRVNTGPYFQESNFSSAHYGICLFLLTENYILLE